MSGLNSSTLHKELITTNFKTSLSGVCFQFGIFTTLNYFYTELAGFPPLYYLWYKSSHILLYHSIQHWGPHDLLRKGGCHQESCVSIHHLHGSLRVLPFPLLESLQLRRMKMVNNPLQPWGVSFDRWGKSAASTEQVSNTLMVEVSPSVFVYMPNLWAEMGFDLQDHRHLWLTHNLTPNFTNLIWNFFWQFGLIFV